MPDAPPLAPADRAIVEAAARAMAEHGLDIPLPWEGDLDDAERERFEALCAALTAALPLVADSIEQSAHDPGSGGEIYVLVREAKRLRALAARLAEAGNE